MADEDRPMSTADLANVGEAQAPGTAAVENVASDQQPTQEGSPPATLLPDGEVADLRRKWDNVQAGFVDEPRRAVEDADALVAAAMKRLAEIFAAERSSLEGQWSRGDNVSTEDLRLALQKYRTFFGRLLTV